ncbi:MAG: hypothetical protein U9R19_17770, partial [Bacteroidota bacterium]|nr:hypothetical protein [Bacteroidota bacterium]
MKHLFSFKVNAMLAFMLLSLSIMANAEISSLSFPWSYSNTGNNHTIFIPINSVNFDGQNLEAGDAIGVFYSKNQNLYCGGYVEINNNFLNISITAWGDDPATSNKDGFDPGENIYWKIYRGSTDEVYNASATYSTGLPNQGLYEANGMSGLSSLSGYITNFPWSYINTGQNHTILIQQGVATINGQSLEPNDIIGVFYQT